MARHEQAENKASDRQRIPYQIKSASLFSLVCLEENNNRKLRRIWLILARMFGYILNWFGGVGHAHTSTLPSVNCLWAFLYSCFDYYSPGISNNNKCWYNSDPFRTDYKITWTNTKSLRDTICFFPQEVKTYFPFS